MMCRGEMTQGLRLPGIVEIAKCSVRASIPRSISSHFVTLSGLLTTSTTKGSPPPRSIGVYMP